VLSPPGSSWQFAVDTRLWRRLGRAAGISPPSCCAQTAQLNKKPEIAVKYAILWLRMMLERQ
jgi:hypothetical protein